MQQRGRRSAASLSVVAGTIDGRPKPPENLSKIEAEIWNQVVASEAADWFKTAALRQTLERYCVHTAEVRWLDEAIAEAKDSSDTDLEALDRLMKMRDREARGAVTFATKLRLTNQSRYQPSVAAVAAKNAGDGRKLWQRG